MWSILGTMKNIKNGSITLRSLFVSIALIGAIVVTGCNTWQGVGEDTEAVGEEIQRSSR